MIRLIFGTFLSDRTYQVDIEFSVKLRYDEYVFKLFFKNMEGVLGQSRKYFFSTLPENNPLVVYVTTTQACRTYELTLINNLCALAVDSQVCLTNEWQSMPSYFEEVVTLDGLKYAYVPTSYSFTQVNEPVPTMTAEQLQKREQILAEAKAVQDAQVIDVAYFARSRIENIASNYSEPLNRFNQQSNVVSKEKDLALSPRELQKLSEIEQHRNVPIFLARLGQTFQPTLSGFILHDNPHDFADTELDLSQLSPGVRVIRLYYKNPAKFNTKRTLKSVFEKLKRNIQCLDEIHVKTLHSRNVDWSPASMPYVKNITETSITIGGLASNETATLFYAVFMPQRTKLKQQFAPGATA